MRLYDEPYKGHKTKSGKVLFFIFILIYMERNLPLIKKTKRRKFLYVTSLFLCEAQILK